MKKIIFIVGIAAIVVFFVLFLKPLPPQTPSVSTCNELTIISPNKNQQVPNTFLVKVIVDNRNPKCHWTVFEAQAGKIEIADSKSKLIGSSILHASGEWMTNNPVTYT